MIDLDVAGPAPESAPGRRRPRTDVPRPLRVLAVLVLALVTLGSATAPPAPELRMVLAANGTAAAAFVLGADSLYTASHGIDNPSNESAVRRFDLVDGSLRWAAALPQGVQNLQVADDAGVLMARSGTDPRVTFLDHTTGAVLWRLASANTSVVTLTGRGVLIRTDVPGATELRLADPRTGRTRWQRRLDPWLSYGPDDLWSGTARRIIAIAASGSVTTLDFGTGATLAAGRLDGRLHVEGDRVHTVGDNRLVVFRPATGALPLTAYSVVPFAPLWRSAESGESVSDCGPVWCLTRPDVTGVDAVDPATGRVRWRTGEVGSAVRLSPEVLAGYATGEEPRMTLLDPATGRVRQRLGTVVPVGGLLLHSDSEMPGQAWVTVRQPGGAIRTLGRVDTAVPFGCAADGRYLACPTTDGPTKVWRLP